MNLNDIIDKFELFKEYEFILKEIVEKSKYLFSDKEEKIIVNM